MSTAIAMAGPKAKAAEQKSRRISKEEFLRRYTNREDGQKYEWNDGNVEKTTAMNQYQSRFFFLLNRLFISTDAFKNGGGLIAETDMDTSEVQLRRPDIAFYTGDQINRMKPGENQVAPFVIEVISPNDKAEDINKKLEEYFRAGVQVVWHIFPETRKVDIYTSPDKVKICRGKAICSAAPAIPDLILEAETLFA